MAVAAHHGHVHPAIRHTIHALTRFWVNLSPHPRQLRHRPATQLSIDLSRLPILRLALAPHMLIATASRPLLGVL
jgi:hypothetical protein